MNTSTATNPATCTDFSVVNCSNNDDIIAVTLQSSNDDLVTLYCDFNSDTLWLLGEVTPYPVLNKISATCVFYNALEDTMADEDETLYDAVERLHEEKTPLTVYW